MLKKAIVVEAEEWNPEVNAPLRMDNASQVHILFSFQKKYPVTLSSRNLQMRLYCIIFTILGTDWTCLCQNTKIGFTNSRMPTKTSGKSRSFCEIILIRKPCKIL